MSSFKYIHHQSFTENTQGRDFVVGDLHGCLSLFHQAMDAVNFDCKTDRVFSVGDLIDRGPDSLGCLALLTESWFFAVQGNHENMMIASLKAGEGSAPWQGWMDNGGRWYKELTRQELEILKSLLPHLTQMPVAMTINLANGKKIGISHAQNPVNDWQQLNDEKKFTGDEIWRALWGRETIRKNLAYEVNGVDATFHGHTIVPKPKRLGNMWFIDTGAYTTDKLFFSELDDSLLSR